MLQRPHKYYNGKSVVFRGRRGKGSIIGIEEDFKRIEWDGMKCLFIEVLTDAEDEPVVLCHPSDFVKR